MSVSAFFLPKSSDALYVTIRDGDDERCEEARRFVELLWTSTEPYLDRDFRAQAADRFETRFWEMYLAWSLLKNGVALHRRESRPAAAGPDLRTVPLGTWIEAVLATRGEGENAVPDLSEAFGRMPEEEMILRLRSALESKARKYADYRESGQVGDAEPYVVAVGVRRIPLGQLDAPLPRVVCAVLPYGHQEVRFELESGRAVDVGYQYRPEIMNARNAPVRTDLFLDPAYGFISGVLYAGVDELNRPALPGPEFIFVHNPSAVAPLPRGFFPFGREYWAEDDQLRRFDHPTDGGAR